MVIQSESGLPGTINVAPLIGLIIVTYNSENVVLECLESVFSGMQSQHLRVVVVDNDSQDGTVDAIEQWAAGKRLVEYGLSLPLGALKTGGRPTSCAVLLSPDDDAVWAHLTVIRSPINGGYAHGVNSAIRFLASSSTPVCGFWVLNPDCVAAPGAAAVVIAYAMSGANNFASGRCLLYEKPEIIQTDGGRVDRRTGVCRSVNAGRFLTEAKIPSPDALDYPTGANFYIPSPLADRLGLMDETFFLYFEEVEWAWRAKPGEVVPLVDAIVYHRGGASIGSATITQSASPMANYFSHRNRIRFVRRYLKASLFSAYVWTVAKSAQVLLKTGPAAAASLLAGAFELPPPRSVKSRIKGADAQHVAFGK